ncbi:MAG: hypothetical protein R3C59_10810 [Planctomycetaceae bacterium]
MTIQTELRLQLRQQPEVAASLDASLQDLQERLYSALSDLIVDEAFAFRIIDFDLSPEDSISLVWTIDDVLAVRPDLTAEQARVALRQLKRTHDATIGVNWDVIAIVVEGLFGDPPDA